MADVSDVHSLTLGDIVLTGDQAFADPEHGFWFQVCAEGTDFGDPEAVTRIVQSLLLDGDVVDYVRDGNRTVPVRVRVKGPTLASVAEGAAVLRRATKRRNELTWQPPDEMSPASVYESYPSPMSRVKDNWDLDELVRERTFSLNLTCSPYARSAMPVTFAALEAPPVSPTTVTINNADTTAGWSVIYADYAVDPNTYTGVVTDEGSFVQASATGMWLRLHMSLTTAPVSMAGTRYLAVEYGGSPSPRFQLTLDGVTAFATPVLVRATGSTIVFVFDCGSSTFSGLKIMFDEKQTRPVTRTIQVADVSRTDTLNQVTRRQSTRVIPGAGTERSPGTIHIASTNPATALGLSIVHTSPETGSGYSPPLRRWRISGNTVTATGNTFSGSSEPLNATTVLFEQPNKVLPAGDYALCAMLKSSATGTFPITWSASTRLAGTSSYTAGINGTTPVQFYTTTDWHFVSLTPLTLPTMRGNDGTFTRIGLQFLGSGATIIYDEAWPFRVGDDCALTVVGSTPQHLWLDSPSRESARAKVMVSTLADRSDEWHPGPSLLSMGTHMLHEGGTALFVATSNFDNPAASGQFYPLWADSAAI